jgi:hypothetical protein
MSTETTPVAMPRSTAPPSARDATSANTGRDAKPANTGRDASPAHTGRDATPAYAGRDGAGPSRPRNATVIGLNQDVVARFARETASPEFRETTPLESLRSSSVTTLRPIRAALVARQPLGPSDIESLARTSFRPGHRRSSEAHSVLSEREPRQAFSPFTTLEESPASTSSPFPSDLENLLTSSEPSSSPASGVADPRNAHPLNAAFDQRLLAIAHVTESLRSPTDPVDNVFSALQFTFNAKDRQNTFPDRIVPVQVPRGASYITRFQLYDEYAAHLLMTMALATSALNSYLQAAGSVREFSFGSVSHFGGRTIAELVNANWATALVASSVEQRILHRLAAAYTAILQFSVCTEFEPRQGYPRVVSPAFTDNTEFADRLYNVLEAKPSATPFLDPHSKSPEIEDQRWSRNLNHDVEEAHATLPSPRPRIPHLPRTVASEPPRSVATPSPLQPARTNSAPVFAASSLHTVQVTIY